MQIWALIVDSFREAIDRKIFWIMILVSVIVAGAMACIGFNDKGFDILLGTWQYESEYWAAGSEQARARIASVVVRGIVALTIGWVGIILTLIATASTFPSLMQPGAIDIIVSKPISRTMIFLGKYVGAMVFILVQAVIFVGLTFLVVGLRWRYWLWGYLWVIPLMVLLFSYVFCFSALFAVITRRAMTALLLALIAWVAIVVPQRAYSVFLVAGPDLDPDQHWQRLFGTVRYVLPKTQDILVIASKAVGAAPETEVLAGAVQPKSNDDRARMHEAQQAEEKIEDAVDVAESIGTSLASEAVVVMLAIWLFKRKDF